MIKIDTGRFWDTSRFWDEWEDSLVVKLNYYKPININVENGKTIVNMICTKCKNINEFACSELFSANAPQGIALCKFCYERREQWDNERFYDWWYSLPDKHEFIIYDVNIVTGKSIVEIFHRNCKKYSEWRVCNLYDATNKCKYCKISRGEARIREYLVHNEISFEREKRFPSCVYKKPLIFDFYLPLHDVVIEFQGEQHFRPIGFGSQKGEKYIEEVYEEVVARDATKKQWCVDNGIPLWEIRYDEIDNVKEILDRKLRIFKF